MFHFGGFPSCTYGFSTGSMSLRHRGCPIRRSTDIMLICSSPWLIAACHVLLRLLMPRHSPYALFRLNLLFGSLIAWVSQIIVWLFSFVLPPFVAKLQFFTNLQKDLRCLTTAIFLLEIYFHIFRSIICSFFLLFGFQWPFATAFAVWWRWWDSNPWPPACRAGALPTELHPHVLVGLSGLEPPTSRLSGVCSNQLSYKPIFSY